MHLNGSSEYWNGSVCASHFNILTCHHIFPFFQLKCDNKGSVNFAVISSIPDRL